MKLQIQTPRAFLPLLAPARYKGAHGGRGSGKSHFFAESLIEYCMMHQCARAVCIREVQRSLEQSVKRLIEDKIQELKVGSLFRVLTTHIEAPGEGIIIFQGMQNHTAESIKSLEGYDVAWVEEAQAFSQRSLDLLRPTLRKEDSELWFSWNPDSPDDPVDKFLRSATPPPGAIVVEVNPWDNPWFPDVLKREMLWDQTRDPEKYAHIWQGQYAQQSDAQVLRGKWVAQEFVPQEGWDGPYYGADWGFSVDPTTLLRAWLSPEGKLYVEREAYQVGCDLDRIPDLFDQVPESRKHKIRADAARPETISHMVKKGFRIEAAAKWSGSVEDGISWLRGLEQIVIHPRCRHTIDEAKAWRYKTDRLTGDVMPTLIDGNEHCWDAIRYALAPLIRQRQPWMGV